MVDPARIPPLAFATVEPNGPFLRGVLGKDRSRPAFEALGLVVMVPLTYFHPRAVVTRPVAVGSSVKVPVVLSG